jgi:hypothetical protein
VPSTPSPSPKDEVWESAATGQFVVERDRYVDG